MSESTFKVPIPACAGMTRVKKRTKFPSGEPWCPQGGVSVFNGLLHFVRNDMGKKRAKFPSGGGVARSAGVVLRVRDDVYKIKDHLPAARYSSTGGELRPRRERNKVPLWEPPTEFTNSAGPGSGCPQGGVSVACGLPRCARNDTLFLAWHAKLMY